MLLKWLIDRKEDLLHLVYPKACVACGNELLNVKETLCVFCMNELEFTYFEKYSEPTPLDQLFWGRVSIESTYSMLYFRRGKSVRPVLHALKYKNQPFAGFQFGKMIGEKCNNANLFNSIDAIVPVPLHPKKQFIRGYNQSEKLADGIASVLEKPVFNDFIIRNRNTESQTKKNKYLRWESMQQKFSVLSGQKQKLNHILLVDDVVTTGSTLEVIIKEIHKNYPELRVSIATLAIAKQNG